MMNSTINAIGSNQSLTATDSIDVKLNLGFGTGFSLDVDLKLPAHGVTALFGPSGCGKTTTLRCIAGLEKAPHALIKVGNQVWQDTENKHFLPTYKRPIGYVFQEASLFPHMTVERNLKFGMKRAGLAKASVSWEQTLKLLDIAHLLSRMPAKLSGGERQRVGMARALLTSPRLLLMDEPLAALDRKRKQEILPYLERLHHELEIPVIYVSHSPEEVARLADHIVLMQQGKVLASGSIQNTLSRLDLPADLLDDAGVVIEAHVEKHLPQYHLSVLRFSGGDVLVQETKAAVGAGVRMRVKASDVSIALQPTTGSSINNSFEVCIVAIAKADSPAHVLVKLNANGCPLIARITSMSTERLGLVVGKKVWAEVKSVAVLS